jgi:transposase
VDRPALLPLPAVPYSFAEWRKARANIDYHVEVDRHYYSVPHVLAREAVEVRLSSTAVEIFHSGRRVAAHARSHRVGGFTTDPGAPAEGAPEAPGVESLAPDPVG